MSSGTMLSGVCVLCCGRPRVQTKDDHVMLTLCINLWVGLAQLFSVTFMLVGWVWSLSWGIYMVVLSGEETTLNYLSPVSFLNILYINYL